jgi:hypothetical protein
MDGERSVTHVASLYSRLAFDIAPLPLVLERRTCDSSTNLREISIDEREVLGPGYRNRSYPGDLACIVPRD